jgi:hypothetical protein
LDLTAAMAVSNLSQLTKMASYDCTTRFRLGDTNTMSSYRRGTVIASRRGRGIRDI